MTQASQESLDSKISEFTATQPRDEDDYINSIVSDGSLESWKSWSTDNSSIIGDLLNATENEPEKQEQVVRILNAVTGDYDVVNDDGTVSGVTRGTRIEIEKPRYELLEEIGKNLLSFYNARLQPPTEGQLQLVFDGITGTYQSLFNQEIKLPTINITNSLKEMNTFFTSFLPKSGLDTNILRNKLDEKINNIIQNKEQKFADIRGNVDNKLQIMAEKAIDDETYDKSIELVNSLDTYKAAMDQITKLYSEKELNNEQKMKILSLWNNLLSLNELVNQYQKSGKIFNNNDFQIIIDFLKDLTKQINELIEEAESAQPKAIKQKTDTESKSAFQWLKLGRFNTGTKGGKRKTQKKRRFSKKNKGSKGGKGNKSKSRKANRKTKRSKK